jgi:hypothetical protein
MLKGNMKDRAFATVDDVLEAVILTSNGVTFEERQSAFLNWMKRVEWVTSKGENHTSPNIK